MKRKKITADEWEKLKFGHAFAHPEAVALSNRFAHLMGRDPAENWDRTLRIWYECFYAVDLPQKAKRKRKT